jgi:hypothetical protein
MVGLGRLEVAIAAGGRPAEGEDADDDGDPAHGDDDEDGPGHPWLWGRL